MLGYRVKSTGWKRIRLPIGYQDGEVSLEAWTQLPTSHHPFLIVAIFGVVGGGFLTGW